MMTKTSRSLMLAGGIAAALLSACSKKPAVVAENASVEEVVAKTKEVVKMEPGQWTTKIELLSLDMPGVKDPNVLNAIKQNMGRAQAKPMTTCLTPEEVAQPPEKMFAGKNSGECKFAHYTIIDGKLSAEMNCASPDGQGAMKMTMAGAFSSTAYDVTSEMNVTGKSPDGAQGMRMKAHVTASRTGACTGKEDVS